MELFSFQRETVDSGLCPKLFTFSAQRHLHNNHRHPNFTANYSHSIVSDPPHPSLPHLDSSHKRLVSKVIFKKIEDFKPHHLLLSLRGIWFKRHYFRSNPLAVELSKKLLLIAIDNGCRFRYRSMKPTSLIRRYLALTRFVYKYFVKLH